MYNSIDTLYRFSLCSVTLFLAGSLPAAPDSPPEAAGQVEALLARHLAASGAEAGRGQITARRATGWIERNNKKIPYVQSQRAPNLLQTETRFPRPGTLKQGFDGTAGWVLHPLQGGKMLAGGELAALAASAWFNPLDHVREMFAVRRWGGARTVEGRALLALEFGAQPGGPFETWLFDAETALLARIEKTVDAGRQGLVPVTQLFEDYREVEGQKFPFRVRTRLPTVETVLQFETVEHNVSFPDGFFSAPFSE